MAVPYFRIPLNLPHAGTIAYRLEYHLKDGDVDGAATAPVRRLIELLEPYRLEGENPSDAAESRRVVDEAARLGREVVDAVERLKLGSDRLGQAVRNLFECLELGQEGAQISLRAGENPNSALRPQ
jgi:hypothetical protein